MNIPKLRGKIVEHEMSVESVAAEIGVDRASLYRKLNDSEKFTLGEIRRLLDVLHLSDREAVEIFLR